MPKGHHVTLRKVPAALALGLLASLVAHAGLYRGDHAMGGAYHALLLDAAGAAAVGLALVLAAFARMGSRLIADGSVVAARLQGRLPSLGAVVASATLWYATAESIEPRHGAASPAAALIALAVAAWLVLRIARWFAAALARVAIAIARVQFSPRAPAWQRRPQSRPVARRQLLARRRFARPPPIATLICA